jgi:methylglutaconyl-CoA hydratase
MSALHVQREGPVLRVTLSRPERRNAFDAALIAELTKAFADVGDARAVVLSGEGESFCAGADVEWQRSAIDLTYEENVEDALRLYRMCEAIDGCPTPVVAQVQGHALGGGSGLVACSDVAVAAEDTVFGFTEVRLGIVPAVISPFVLAKVSPGAARRWFLTGERFDAHVALRIGLVQEVVEPGRQLDRAIELAEAIATKSAPLGVQTTLASAHRARLEGEEAAFARLNADMAALFETEDGREGLQSFIERREAKFTGR